jgi:CO/xanthine dehydrogenase Mo-binding subunit
VHQTINYKEPPDWDQKAHELTDDGGVDCTVEIGVVMIGQGHETTFPQILDDRLDIPNALIRLVQGDTDRIPLGGGHGSSRATYMGGTAIWRASDEVTRERHPYCR